MAVPTKYLQVFSEGSPFSNHSFDDIGLFLCGRPQKNTIVLEDAGHVVCMCHQFFADVWNTEFCPKGEVVATGGQKIREGWSHFAVVSGHLHRTNECACRCSLVQDYLKGRSCKDRIGVKVCDCILVFIQAARPGSEVIQMYVKGFEKGFHLPR